jgi:pimeloyl-ACP methyl ester carboxylesterase
MPVADSNPAAISENFCYVEGIRLRYLRRPCTGTPTGPPLVLVSGLLGYSFSWRYNLLPLSRCADIYAIDMPGTGYSDRPQGFAPTFRRLAEIVVGFCDALSLRSYDLLGTSHGGAIAMRAPALPQGRVRRLVLVAPVNPWSAGRASFISFLGTRAGAACAKLASPLLMRAAGYFIRRVYGHPELVTRETLDGYSAPIRVPGTIDQALRALSTWRADVEELRSVLPRIRHVPALLLWGSDDRAILPSSATPLAKNFDQAKIVTLAGVGHLPYEEQPQEFNRAVTEFLYCGAPAV